MFAERRIRFHRNVYVYDFSRTKINGDIRLRLRVLRTPSSRLKTETCFFFFFLRPILTVLVLYFINTQ